MPDCSLSLRAKIRNLSFSLSSWSEISDGNFSGHSYAQLRILSLLKELVELEELARDLEEIGVKEDAFRYES